MNDDKRRCSALLYTRDRDFNLHVLMVRDRSMKGGGRWTLPSRMSEEGREDRDMAIEAVVSDTPVRELDRDAMRLRYMDDGTDRCSLDGMPHSVYGMYLENKDDEEDWPFGMSNEDADPIQVRWFNIQFLRDVPGMSPADVYLAGMFFSWNI